MCDICVMNSVKERMLSRRHLFKGAAMTTAAAALGTVVSAPTAMADGHASVMDMTHMVDETFPTYFGSPGISREAMNTFAKDGFNLNTFTVMEHTGTHIDAPLHFSADGQSVDEIPVSSLVCPLAVIDIAARAAGNADTQVTPDDLKAWISANGPIPDSACVAMHSGWAAKVRTDGFRNADAEGKMHFPGFHIEAVKMLMEETRAKSIAVDTLSLDHGLSADFAVHYGWLPTNRYGIECMAGLDQVPAAGATLVVGAPKFGKGTGGPARIFAMV
ncbi:MAG: cyclase family protein [Aliishimia sp.]